MMDANLKAKWIADLRANLDKQGKGALRSIDEKYCCLGRFLLQLDEGEWDFDQDSENYRFRIKGAQSLGIIPDSISDFYGFKESSNSYEDQTVMDDLIRLNDEQGLSFSQIADWIEANL